ncbi:GNAT family N-acetyltransferase [Lentzea flava]|uniref:GNAT family N-acetyltransferase n=1 Tax=Lentzea flava TaxID=103732 RepID=A0ABQ2VBF1_9PSEU|nr:GNAT family N-acetyltransferase [Lentzea flava]MCP2204494.1 Acetyltransferase (GNAT) domain-containing protein [Lentzea flava]GGU78498.1 GNAT family N-acetyltransferase [Lentzea flava]
MTSARGLVAAQSARFASLDPLLPPAAEPPADGDVITAALADGTRVAGVISHQTFEPHSTTRLWSAAEVWELLPLVGTTQGMDALLTRWRRHLDAQEIGEDTACVVHWPSRDAQAARAFLDHGLVPLSVLSVRLRTPQARVPRTLTIRRATPHDLDTVLELSLAELEYSSFVGSTIVRPEARALKRRALAERLTNASPIWLAERDGIAVALAECAIVSSEPGTSAAMRLPRGRWGYVNCVSVLPGARGTGIGQQLVAYAHQELHRMGAVGTYLYYNPPNPLSSVFWPRQGYRPLWTVWEVRPASALR